MNMGKHMGKQANAITIWNNSEASHGPAMRALNSRQRQFVYALLETGTTDHTRAARMAGYTSESAQGVRTQAHRLAHNPKVQAALHEEAQKRLGSAKVMAVSELVRIAESSQNEAVKLKAIEKILNRSGLHEKTEHKVVVENEEGSSEVMARIAFLAGALGVDATRLLGTATPQAALPQPAEDAEFEEVVEEEEEEEDTDWMSR